MTMNPFRTLKLKTKLPLIITGLCLSAVVVLQLINNYEFRVASVRSAEEAMDAVSSARRTVIGEWFEDTSKLLLDLTSRPIIQVKIPEMAAARAQLADPTGTLQAAYITANPNPAGQRQALDRGLGIEAYHDLHAALHPMLRKFMDLHGTYDVFLFDTEFNNLYTTAKEADFAAAFGAGPLADSGLGRALHKAEAAPVGEVVASDFSPYEPSGGVLAAFLATKVASSDGRVLGYVAVQVSGESLISSLADRSGLGETGRSYIVGTIGDGSAGQPFLIGTGVDNRIGVSPDDPIGLVDPQRMTPSIQARAEGWDGILEDVPLANGEIGMADVRTVVVGGADMTWSVVIERENAEIFGAMNSLITQMLLIGAAIAALVTLAGMFLARTITTPVGKLSATLDSIANGDLNVSLEGAERADELGTMAASVGGLVDKLSVAKLAEEERLRLQEEQRQVVEHLSTGLQDLATGNLMRPITAPFPREYEKLRLDFNATLDTLANTIALVIDASSSIRGKSDSISSSSDDLSRRTENQAAALEETAAALDELTASVKSAADGAREVETIVGAARKQAEDSGAVVQAAVDAMAEIEKSSQQISQIIGAIDDIAFQTNLLALNAGVEAARAGDAGKGFAVVASEVRALAQRSSAAAKEIKTLIAASAQHVGRGVDEVGKAGVALQSIVGSVANISSLVSTIATGAAEQSTGLAEINIGVTQLDQVTQQNAAMVGEATASAQALQQDATGLANMVARFRLPQTMATREAPQIDLASFVPGDFAAEVEEAPVAAAPSPRPMRAATGQGTAAQWQDF
jgi:methyl-accepting chemotaxis protein